MRKGQLVLVLVGVLALAAGGTALAGKGRGGGHTVRGVADVRALHGPRGHGDVLETASSYLGISVDALLTQLSSGKSLAQVADATSGKSQAGLVAALVAHEKQELADAVKAGRLTQSQADTIAATLTDRLDAFVTHSGMGPHFGRAPHHGGLETAATYLGISEAALLDQLRGGKTLAQIANATSGKSASGLIDALVADATKRFGTAAPSDLRARITQLVNGQLPAIGPRGGHDHWLPGRRA
jgi:hypothetical protein